MITQVPFPAMSEEDPTGEGVVGTWFVNHGEPVTIGQVIAEVQFEKVSQDVEAPVAGIMYQLVAESVGIAQGQPIARIDS
ncbi:MAG: lipoyl domain-containing protein [Acidimicrobiia bacterium]|nr:lipoyl domain-containing protein [Acidimicrobiia bacterium]